MKFDDFELFFKLLDNADDIFFLLEHPNKKIIYVNKKIETLTFYKNKDILNKNIDSFLTKDLEKENIYYLDDLILEINRKITTHKQNTYEILTARDITKTIFYEKKINQELKYRINELENQKIFLNTLMDNNPTSIFYKDIEGKYQGCNKSWEKLTGLDSEDVLKKSPYDIAPKDIADIYTSQDKKVFNLEENPQIYKSQVYNKKLDKRFDVIFYKSAYFDSNSKVLGLIGVVIDITDILELKNESEEKEKLLTQQSKMATMGEMIENIAHQWKQPLNTITTVSSSIKMRNELGILEDIDINDSVETIIHTTNHLTDTIDDFRDFFKKNKTKNKENIKSIFIKTFKLLKIKIKHSNVKIIENIADINIYILKNELIHVILNIINNACDALNEKAMDEKIIFIDVAKEEQNLIIEIKDNAGGIDEKIIHKIFEPYFTTKEKYDGTGIGLYMSKQIITKNLLGTIKVSNEKYIYKKNSYIGANFKMSLPIK